MTVVSEESDRPDLSVFEELNARPRRVSWVDRKSVIEERFPATRVDTGTLLCSDMAVLGHLMRDILHSAQTPVGKIGAKKKFDERIGREDLATWQSTPYSELPFPQAFRELARDRSTGRQHSLNEIAHKTSISRSRVHRLLSRVEPPTVEDMAVIARAYRKEPSFFSEYRARFVARHLATALEENPEMSQAVYERIVGVR